MATLDQILKLHSIKDPTKIEMISMKYVMLIIH
jgi:hypothetical protein